MPSFTSPGSSPLAARRVLPGCWPISNAEYSRKGTFRSHSKIAIGNTGPTYRYYCLAADGFDHIIHEV